MYEIKILKDSRTDVQQILNTWRHTYSITIHSFQACPFDKGEVYVLLHRTKKADK